MSPFTKTLDTRVGVTVNTQDVGIHSLLWTEEETQRLSEPGRG